MGRVASNLGRPARPPEGCPPEYAQVFMAGFNDEDEEQWTQAEKNEAQNDAAASIDPAKPGNLADVAEALKAKPTRGAKAKAQPDDDSDRDPDDLVSGEVLH